MSKKPQPPIDRAMINFTCAVNDLREAWKEGTHAFNLHIDVSVLESITDQVQAMLDAIYEENEGVQNDAADIDFGDAMTHVFGEGIEVGDGIIMYGGKAGLTLVESLTELADSIDAEKKERQI
jgi:hypothetical protein